MPRKSSAEKTVGKLARMIATRRRHIPTGLLDRYPRPEDAEILYADQLVQARPYAPRMGFSAEALAERRAAAEIESRFEGIRKSEPATVTFSAIAPSRDASSEDRHDRLWVETDRAATDISDTGRRYWSALSGNEAAEWREVSPGLVGDAWDRALARQKALKAEADAALEATADDQLLAEILRANLSPDEWDAWEQRRLCSLQAIAVFSGVTPSAIHYRESRVVRRGLDLWRQNFGDRQPPETLRRRPRHEAIQIAGIPGVLKGRPKNAS